MGRVNYATSAWSLQSDFDSNFNAITHLYCTHFNISSYTVWKIKPFQAGLEKKTEPKVTMKLKVPRIIKDVEKQKHRHFKLQALSVIYIQVLPYSSFLQMSD